MKKSGKVFMFIAVVIILATLCLYSCGGTEQKHHKTDCILTVYSETGDSIKSWKFPESKLRYYQGNDIKFVDTLGNTVWIRVFSGTVIMEKDGK